MASSKRRKNKKFHQRARKRQRGAAAAPPSRQTRTVPRPVMAVPPPEETDHILVFIAEPELGFPESTLPQLERVVSELPFEAAMLHVALLQGRLERVLADPAGHWKLARWFYEDRPALLERYERVLRAEPSRTIFSPQALTLLMRVLIDHALDEPLRELTSVERGKLQDAVLGSHSVLETALEAVPLPGLEHRLAYELQAATFFHRPPRLEEVARHRELLRLADDDRLSRSPNRVPVGDWLAASGLNESEQWAVGFGLAAITHALDDEVRPLVSIELLDDLLAKLGLDVSRELPLISSSRPELKQQFSTLTGDVNEALGWELRPFKATPFLRLADGRLLLMAPPWLLSWIGEGFHYRALTHAQRECGKTTSSKYTTFAGEVVERYALDLAEATAPKSVRVLGEQSYGKDRKLTSDVAIVTGTDLILFEVHARRVAATAAVTGTASEAILEVSKLLVGKADQLGGCVDALLAGKATLPDVEMNDIKRIWPVVVAVGHLRQDIDLWTYLRSEIKDATKMALARDRVQPLQVMDIADFEKLMGFLEAGENLPDLFVRRLASPFRERELAVWLAHDPNAPSPHIRASVLKARWSEMGQEVTRAIALAGEISSDVDS
jgi:hypothetical protein